MAAGTKSQYELINKLWQFLKLYGTPENNQEYWHEAVLYSQENFKTDLEIDCALFVLNKLQEVSNENKRRDT